LTGAGMLLRSLWKLQSVPLGFQAEHVLTADFVLSRTGYAQPPKQLQFFSDLETRLKQMSGASAVAITDSLPPSGGARGRLLASIQVEGEPPYQEGTGGMITWRYVTPGYFSALGIPIVRGRGFRDEDRAPSENAVVVSESLARRMFPNGDAIGHRLHMESWNTIIGIAADVRNLGALRPADPEYYLLRKRVVDETFQNQGPGGWRAAKAVVRTSVNPQITADWIKREIAALDPTLPVTIGSMQDRVTHMNERPRFNAFLLALFAGMGVLLAAIGLYGVMAFLVGQRTQEIGVRMALGATPGTIAKLVLSRAAVWTIAGAVVGLIGSLLAARTLRTLLFQVPERDPLTYAIALPLLLAIALASAWIPSMRASHVDPMAALRHE